MHVCVCVFMCQSTCVKVREQLTGTGSLFLPCRSQESNSGGQICQQVTLPVEPSHWLKTDFFFLFQFNYWFHLWPITTSLHWEQFVFIASSLANAASHLDCSLPHSELAQTGHLIRHSQNLEWEVEQTVIWFYRWGNRGPSYVLQVVAESLKPGVWNLLATVLSTGLQNTNKSENILISFILQLHTLI